MYRALRFLTALSLLFVTCNDVRAGLLGTGIFDASWQLASLNTSTGAGSIIGPAGPTFDVNGLAYDRNTDTLYGSDTSLSGSFDLVTIDPITGAATEVGSLGFAGIGGLAFDPNTNTLYGTGYQVNDRNLFTINTSTGAASQIGLDDVLGFDAVQGLAFDPNLNILYGSDTTTDQLVTINTTTGVGTAVGDLHAGGGGPSIFGLAFDSASNILYGTSDEDFALYTINPLTGLASQIGETGLSTQVSGLAFASAVPEPSTVLLSGLGVIALLGYGWSRRITGGGRMPKQAA